MVKQHFVSFTILLVLSYTTTTPTLAQSPSPSSPAAQPPAPSGPLNVSHILEKGGQFMTFIHLLKSTDMVDQINTQLNNSNQGLTILAPTDNAFSALKPGTLNSITDQQKVSLIQYHVIPSLISLSQFQTLSNPVRTQAGTGNGGQFPLNVTTAGTQVNVSTGLVDTTIGNTIYSDSQLAVYQVDKVLLPVDIFRPSVPVPAPAPSKLKKGSNSSSASDGPSSDSTNDDSSAMGLKQNGRMLSVAIAMILSFCL